MKEQLKGLYSYLYQKISIPFSKLPRLFNKTFYEFEERLKIQRAKKVMPAPLQALISQEDLNAIYDFFIEKKQKEHIENIKKMPKGSTYRLDKAKTHLERTVNVIRSKDDEYYLILETKSKLKGKKEGKREKEPKDDVCGIDKCGKSAWRIDKVGEYFNLVVRLHKKEKKLQEQVISNIQKEVALSHCFSEERVVHLLMGSVYTSENDPTQPKVNLYAEKGIPFNKFIEEGRYELLTEEQKKKLWKQILFIIKEIHDANWTFQDIKLENLIIFELGGGRYRLKLTDMGLAEKHEDEEAFALATNTFQSPEIAHGHFSKDDPEWDWYRYFRTQESLDSLGHQMREHYHAVETEKEIEEEAIEEVACLVPDKANDMWSLGILLFKLKYGYFPQKKQEDLKRIQQNPLLAALLEPKRNKRIEINPAIQLFEETKSRIMRVS